MLFTTLSLVLSKKVNTVLIWWKNYLTKNLWWWNPAATQSPEDVPWSSPQKVLTSGIYERPSGNAQGTNIKTDELKKKMFFRWNSHIYYCFFTGRTNIQNLWMERDFAETKWWDVLGTPAWRRSNMLFKFNSQTHNLTLRGFLFLKKLALERISPRNVYLNLFGGAHSH